MRIFCAIRHSADPAKYYGGLWSANFYPAIRALGHQIIESQTDLASTSAFMGDQGTFSGDQLDLRAKATDSVLREIKAAYKIAPVDLFLSYFYNAHFDPAGFDELRRLGIPSINFYCNSVHQFELVKEIAGKVDFAWHTEKSARALYLAAGGNPVWIQMAADPTVYHPVAEAQRACKACFVGQRYADRDRWVAVLVRAGIEVEVYGYGWSRNRPGSATGAPSQSSNSPNSVKMGPMPGSFASYLRAVARNIRSHGLGMGLLQSGRQFRYSHASRGLEPLLQSSVRGPAIDISATLARYEVCLNFSNVWSEGRPGSSLIPHVRLRDFEAPMCRACYLTGHTEEIQDFYEVGREIDTYRTPEELVGKTRFYLEHPTAAEKLREAGYRRAINDHTWENRFDQLFRATNLAPSRIL